MEKKTCNVCKQVKPIDCFGKDSYRKDGYSLRCKECSNAKSKKYRESNKEYYSEYQKQYSKEKKAKCNKEWRQNNNEHMKAYYKDRYAKKKAMLIALQMKYRYNKLNAVPKWFDAKKVLKIYEKAKELGMQVDHVVPLNSKKVCGLHTWENLQLLSRSENLKKGNRYWPDMP